MSKTDPNTVVLRRNARNTVADHVASIITGERLGSEPRPLETNGCGFDIHVRANGKRSGTLIFSKTRNGQKRTGEVPFRWEPATCRKKFMANVISGVSTALDQHNSSIGTVIPLGNPEIVPIIGITSEEEQAAA